MVKKISVILALSILLVTAACGGSSTTGATGSSTITTASSGVDGNELVIGTIKLEGTEQAISAEQASELLVLWKAMRTLSSSDTTSQLELDALLQQIEDTLTSEQVSAIKAMDISTDNMADVMADLGIKAPGADGEEMSEEDLAAMAAAGQSPQMGGEMPSGGGGGTMPSGGGGGGGGAMPSGGGGGAMPSGGGGMTFGGGEMPADASAMTGVTADETTSTTQVARVSSGINTMLLNALIEKLTEWAG